jgi:hypothetical protein
MRTSLYSILCIGIRLAAVLLAANAVLAIPTGYITFAQSDFWKAGNIGWYAVIWLVILLFAVLLWIYPGMLARLAAGKASQQIFESPLSAADFQQIAFSIVVLWILLAGLIGITQIVVREVIVEHVLRSADTVDDTRRQLIAQLLDDVLQMLIGAVLMLRAGGLVGLLRRAREAGKPAPASREEEQT